MRISIQAAQQQQLSTRLPKAQPSKSSSITRVLIPRRQASLLESYHHHGSLLLFMYVDLACQDGTFIQHQAIQRTNV